MSVFKQIEKIKICKGSRIIYAIDKSGNYKQLLHFKKPNSLSFEEYDELIMAINIKFKLPSK